MADAMIGGILKANCASKYDVIGSAKTVATCERMTQKHGIATYELPDNVELIEKEACRYPLNHNETPVKVEMTGTGSAGSYRPCGKSFSVHGRNLPCSHLLSNLAIVPWKGGKVKKRNVSHL